MFDSSGMSTANYDSTLIKWSQQGLMGQKLGAKGLNYCLADSARSILMNTLNWAINGDTLNCLGVGLAEESFLEENPRTFKMYPNPAQEWLNVLWQREQKPEEPLYIYNVQGILVLETKGNKREQRIHTASLAAGFYLVKWGNSTQRLIIRE